MGCTQSSAGPRAVVPPVGKATEIDNGVPMLESKSEVDEDDVPVGLVSADGVPPKEAVGDYQYERRRLTILRQEESSNPGKAARARAPSAESLKDPGQDIGNGAFGENLDYAPLGLCYSCVTRPGNDPAKRQKENQDTYCVHAGLGRDQHALLACVFDGHGPNGARASHFVRDRLVQAWTEMGLDRPSCSGEEEVRRVLHNGCVEVNHKLATSNIDVYVSGSTGIMAVLKGNKLFVANVGDSRAVLGRAGKNGRLQAVDLSNDQKPDRPDEQARILRYGGRVFEWGVARVWQKETDMPGLAMSRSFGDLAAEAVGVYAEPEVSVVTLSPNDKFLVLASDGVWEFLSSSDVVHKIGKHLASKPPAQAARDACVEVVNASVSRWHEMEDVVDDCTCVIIALS